MSRSLFGWSYPPGVTGMEPEINGMPDDEEDIEPAEDYEPDIDDYLERQLERYERMLED